MSGNEKENGSAVNILHRLRQISTPAHLRLPSPTFPLLTTL